MRRLLLGQAAAEIKTIAAMAAAFWPFRRLGFLFLLRRRRRRRRRRLLRLLGQYFGTANRAHVIIDLNGAI